MHMAKSLLVSLLALGSAASLLATEPSSRAARWTSSEFSAVVSGTSTLHDWSVTSAAASGEINLTDPASASGSLELVAESLTHDADGLKSRMYNALKTKTNPKIAFASSSIEVPATPAVADATETWTVKGRLTIAGVTREITLAPKVTIDAAGVLTLEAEHPVKMTDFGMKPPTFMGMVKTGDAVTIKIRWLLKR